MGKIIAMLMVLLVPFYAIADQHVKWEQGKEILINFTVNSERKIQFPEMVRFALDSKYQMQFTFSNIDNVIFLKPIVNFNERLTFQGLESGRFYIVNAVAISDTPSPMTSDPFVIHLNDVVGEGEEPVGLPDEIVQTQQSISEIQLVQYAAQNLYSPSLSLVEPLTGIKRAPVKQRLLPHFYRGGGLSALPIVSWQGGGMFVTAIKLENKTTQYVSFDACRIRGDFVSATAQFKKMTPLGTSKDFTVVYVISDVPFDVAVDSGRLLCV
ncbi:TIGR03749 family integrating conjugative element protein [Shewanella bicestrii]